MKTKNVLLAGLLITFSVSALASEIEDLGAQAMAEVRELIADTKVDISQELFGKDWVINNAQELIDLGTDIYYGAEIPGYHGKKIINGMNKQMYGKFSISRVVPNAQENLKKSVWIARIRIEREESQRRQKIEDALCSMNGEYVNIPLIKSAGNDKRYSGKFLYRDGDLKLLDFQEIPVDDSLEPTVVFNDQTGVMAISICKVGDENYYAELQVMDDGITFEVTKAIRIY
ncbi:hypothetical protein [methanotrophic endosymbiont of Bathymodiolus puteoserpentis (Logatchev)]|jgi:hypothetical protein|uniref:hypothetical protein n=1 Tax=methanotrophic endosymbiont of Bathymodiolus puteoserpentis (Logatchev) TaxID=343235 RepID=UPI0013CDA616|nr:hypothetical protein [methanotrophic endosymbiont of Bathymodiolus puteoserpentis (Logatchev)]SHE23600.1 hypothetical protein BPUTEOMOX_2950 [methanotrophic endosymbiont of Bathymodiolus puteoserpentis (Logatchev)]